MRRLAFAAALVLLGTTAMAAERILVFGDSLSAAYGIDPRQGWVHLLGERIARAGLPWAVVNASVSGETTSGGLRRLPEDLKRHKPAKVLIELGANDALRGQPIARIRGNLEQMIRLAREAGAQPVLVGMMIPPNYGIDYAAEFRALFPELAKKHKVPVVPFLLEGIAERRDSFQPDGLHPTAEAQPKIADTVWATLGPLLRKGGP